VSITVSAPVRPPTNLLAVSRHCCAAPHALPENLAALTKEAPGWVSPPLRRELHFFPHLGDPCLLFHFHSQQMLLCSSAASQVRQSISYEVPGSCLAGKGPEVVPATSACCTVSTSHCASIHPTLSPGKASPSFRTTRYFNLSGGYLVHTWRYPPQLHTPPFAKPHIPPVKTPSQARVFPSRSRCQWHSCFW
jgi:hypothetical protein